MKVLAIMNPAWRFSKGVLVPSCQIVLGKISWNESLAISFSKQRLLQMIPCLNLCANTWKGCVMKISTHWMSLQIESLYKLQETAETVSRVQGPVAIEMGQPRRVDRPSAVTGRSTTAALYSNRIYPVMCLRSCSYPKGWERTFRSVCL